MICVTQLDTGGKSGVSSPQRGDCCSVSPPSVCVWGGEDGESMLPLEFIQFVLFTIVDAYLSGVLERLTYSSESTVDSFFTLSTMTLTCVKYLD